MTKELEKDAAPDEHAVQLTVWDAPSAIVAGERFKVAVGARCPAGCDLGGRELALYDQDGARACTVRLGPEIRPGTEALYFAEVEAMAPKAAGSHRWEVRIADQASKPPHAAADFPMTLRVVSPPDCLVTVSVSDRETQAPIRGARVVMHPYRAVSDDNGIARVRVARGQYDILVSASRHMPAAVSIEVTADLSTRAELDADQVEVYE